MMLRNGKILLFSVVALAVLAAATAFVVYCERCFQQEGERETQGFGHQIAPYLWDINVETAQEYVDAVEEHSGFHYVEVKHQNGELFVRGELMEPDTGVEGMFRSIGLLRDSEFSQPINYHGQEIGTITTIRTNRNVYTYFYLLPVMVLVFVVTMLLRTLLVDREKRLEIVQELDAVSNRLKSVLDGTPVISCSLNDRGVLTACEGKGLDKLGLRGSELLGKEIGELRGEFPLAHSDFQKAMQGKTFSQVHELDGHSFETCYFPVRQQGHYVGVNAVASDITIVLEAVSQLRKKDSELEEEMRLAREAHRAIMTTEAPDVEGLQIALVSKPSMVVGGDVVHFHQGDEGALGITLCDIRGHGVAAALLSSAFLYMLDEALGEHARDLGGLFTGLNEDIYRHFPRERYASASHVRIDVRERVIHYVAGSKEPVVVVGKGHEPISLQDGAPVLGSRAQNQYEEKSLQLKAGDTVLLFTDGFYDVQDAQGVELSRKQLIRWLDTCQEKAPQDLLDTVYSKVQEFSADGVFRDDVTAIAIRVD